MKTLLLGFLLLLTFQHEDEFVCTPCGYDCDKSVHHAAGKCVSCGMPLVKQSSIKFKRIDVNELCKRVADNPNVVLLDVRSPEEFNGTSTTVRTFGHFKRAININVTELEKRMDELKAYKNAEVIVYCSHSHRSPFASYLLSTRGFTKVENMDGGVSTFTSFSAAGCLSSEFVFHEDKNVKK